MTASSSAGVPIHPSLAHVTVGGCLVAVILDLLSPFSQDGARGLYLAAGYALMVGTGALVIAAITGFIDRGLRTQPGTSQRKAAGQHALAGLLTGAVALADLVLRRQVHPDATHTPAVVVVLSALLGLLITWAAHLGGRLVFRAGVGVATAGAPEPA